MSHEDQRVLIDIYLHGLPTGGEQGQILRRLDRIDAHLRNLTQGVIVMGVELDRLEEQVAKNTEVDQSAITLLNGLATQIAALKNDPVKLQAFADSLRSSSADLAAAVLANTPAAETPPAPPA